MICRCPNLTSDSSLTIQSIDLYPISLLPSASRWTMFWRQCPGTSIEPVLWWIISKWNTCHGLSLLIYRRIIAVDVVGFHALLSSWAQWRLKSPASRLFTRLLIQAQIKENIKVPRHWPLWGEFTGDRWNPRTITMTSEWPRWRLKSPASRLFTQSFIQAYIKENIKAPRHWPLCGEFTGTGEFPAQRVSNAENVSIWWRHHANSQWRRKCFNLMTSPCTHVTYCQLYHWQNTCTLKRWNSNRNVIKFGSKYNTFSKEILAMKMPSTKWQYFSSPFFRLIFTKSIQILYCSSYYITSNEEDSGRYSILFFILTNFRNICFIQTIMLRRH